MKTSFVCPSCEFEVDKRRQTVVHAEAGRLCHECFFIEQKKDIDSFDKPIENGEAIALGAAS